MALEIEHKFLVEEDSYIEMAVEVREIRQGYLQRDPARTVRIRTVGDRGYVTVKGITVGDTRREYEYEIPLADAREMLAMCLPPVIEKRRYVVPFAGKTWEVDRFGGPLAPLVTAEIELSEPGEHYETPPFVGREVTGDPVNSTPTSSDGYGRPCTGRVRQKSPEPRPLRLEAGRPRVRLADSPGRASAVV